MIARPEPIEVGALDENTIRPLGRQLPLLAAAYLFAGDPAYLAAARRQLDRVADLRDWADNRDIGAAALLGGMAIAYDWLYAQLSDAERARYRARMARQADAFYRMLSEGKPWWTTDFLQNHNYTNAASLALAAMALHGEHPDTERWLRAARRNFDQVLEQLSPDGASHEGVGYWASGLLSALKYFLAVEPVFGLDAVRASSYFRLAARYRLHMSLPGFVEIADYADSARYEWQGPECQLRALGHIFGDGLAQGLAERIETARGEVQPPGARGSECGWLNLVWYDPDLAAGAVDDQPLAAYFDNMGIFVARSGWDDMATWVLFKAGPSQGQQALQRGIYLGLHVHPDAGTINLWSAGRWVLQDDGYVDLKRTANHNLLLVNGAGQAGEGRKWFDGGAVRRARARSRMDAPLVQQDGWLVSASPDAAYPAQAGLGAWTRTLHFEATGGLRIVDEVQLARAGPVEFLYHLAEQPREAVAGGHCVAAGMRSEVRLANESGSAGTTTVSPYRIGAAEQHSGYGNYAGYLLRDELRGTRLRSERLFVRDAACTAPVGGSGAG